MIMTHKITSEPEVFPVVEEEPVVRKEAEVTGAVRVTQRVREEMRRVSTDLASEGIEIERVPCDEFVEGPVPERREGDTLVLSVVEEVPVVVTRYRLVEQVRVTRRRRTERWEDRVPVRRLDVAVERLDPPVADEGANET
jgi:stress response protein YsnF